MKIELTVLPIDAQVTGFELGDIALLDDGAVISSAGHSPNQSMMIFLFLSDFIEQLIEFNKSSRAQACSLVAVDSSFCLTLKLSRGILAIANKGTTISLSFQLFSQILYSLLSDWLKSIQPKIAEVDSALIEFYNSLDKLRRLVRDL